MSKLKGSNMTEAEFNQIKQLTELIAVNTKIAELVNRSDETVARIRRSATWPSYQTYVRQIAGLKTAKQPPVAQPELKNNRSDLLTGDTTALVKELADLKIAIYALRKAIISDGVPVSDKTKRRLIFNTPFRSDT